jgi:hypothetical protein
LLIFTAMTSSEQARARAERIAPQPCACGWPRLSPASTDHDFCTICASIARAGAPVLPRPPAAVVVTLPRRKWLTDRVIILVSTDGIFKHAIRWCDTLRGGASF